MKPLRYFTISLELSSAKLHQNQVFFKYTEDAVFGWRNHPDPQMTVLSEPRDSFA